MNKTIIITIIFLGLYIGIASAEVSIKAQVDKTNITTDEEIAYKLIIASTQKNLPKPTIPKFTGFKILSQAQTSEIALKQGKFKTLIVYAFVLAPLQIGKLNIEPATLTIKNERYSTAAFEIEVKPGKAVIPPKTEEKSLLPDLSSPGSEQVSL